MSANYRSFTEEERHRPKARITSLSYAKLLRELIDGPATRRELVETTGLSLVTVNSILTALRAEKLVRICSWMRDAKGCQTIMVFEFAPDKPNVEKKKDPHRIRAKRWRANVKARQHFAALTATVQG